MSIIQEDCWQIQAFWERQEQVKRCKPKSIRINLLQQPLRYETRRKLRLIENGGSHTIEQWEALKAVCCYKCLLCGKKKPLTRDHIVSVCKGGSDNIENIQPLCKECNFAKWLEELAKDRIHDVYIIGSLSDRPGNRRE